MRIFEKIANLLLPNLPSKQMGFFFFISPDLLNDARGRHFRFATPNLAWVNSASSFISMESAIFSRLNVMVNVSTNLFNILLTHPWLTASCLEISQGLTPWRANWRILKRSSSGRGRPFVKTLPYWFTFLTAKLGGKYGFTRKTC